MQSKENVDKRALANRHMLHKLDKQAISLYFVSTFAQSKLSKTWLEIKTWVEECLSKLVETGYELSVIEREHRTFLWTSASLHCVLVATSLRRTTRS